MTSVGTAGSNSLLSARQSSKTGGSEEGRKALCREDGRRATTRFADLIPIGLSPAVEPTQAEAIKKSPGNGTQRNSG